MGLKDEYQLIYLDLHAKVRLNAADDNRKTALMNDKRVNALKQLGTIELLPEQLANQLLSRISGLRTCWNLTKKDLDQQVECPHCKYCPKSEAVKKLESLSRLDDEVQDLLEAWTGTIIETLNHPEIKTNIPFLGPEQQELLQTLLTAGVFSLPLNAALLQAITELFQGIEKVKLSWTEIKEALGNGNPLTYEEVNARFTKVLQKHIGNQPLNRIRMVLSMEKEE